MKWLRAIPPQNEKIKNKNLDKMHRCCDRCHTLAPQPYVPSQALHGQQVEAVAMDVERVAGVEEVALVYQHHLYCLVQTHLKSVGAAAEVPITWWVLINGDRAEGIH